MTSQANDGAAIPAGAAQSLGRAMQQQKRT